MDHLGAPDLVRAAFAQAEQAGGVVYLAVEQDDRVDTGIAQCAGWLHWREGLELGTDVRRGVAQDPVLAIVRQCNGGLGTRCGAQGAIAVALAVGAIAVPLRKPATGGGTENLDVHGCSLSENRCQKRKRPGGPRRLIAAMLSGWRSTWSLRSRYAGQCKQVWSTWAFSFRMGLGGQLLVWRRLGEEVPLTEIALSYKKNLYRKVNYSKSAVAVSVTIRLGSVPTGIRRRGVGQAHPAMLGCQQGLPEPIQMHLLCRQDRPP